MSNTELLNAFYSLCMEHSIDSNIAIENNTVRAALKERDLDKIKTALNEQF